MIQISQINLNGTTYELKDRDAHTQLDNLTNLANGVKSINGLSGDVTLSLTKDANNVYALSVSSGAVVPPVIEPDTPFAALSRKIQNGTLSAEYSIGDIITCEHDEFGELAWQIVDFDSEELVDTSIQHSVTLCLSGCLSGTYEYDTISEYEQNYAPDESQDPTGQYFKLGRWKYSTARQWLNTSGDANAWWTQLISGDTAPSYANRAGFLKGLESDFLTHIADVKLKSNVYSYNGWDAENYSWTVDQIIEETIDKVFLPAGKNLISSSDSGSIGFYLEPDIKTWEYFESNYENLVKYDENDAYANYYTRTASDEGVYAYAGGNFEYFDQTGEDPGDYRNYFEPTQDPTSKQNFVICCVLV